MGSTWCWPPRSTCSAPPSPGATSSVLQDPLLTAELASALVTEAQRGGIGMCPKHFAANDSETERTTYLAKVDERTLREVYLAPFERLVADGAWTIMAAYSGTDDGHTVAPDTNMDRCCAESSSRTGVSTAWWSAIGSPPSRSLPPFEPASTSRCPGRTAHGEMDC